MTENIIQNAGKVLLEIYIYYKNKNKIPNFNELLDKTKLEKEKLERALEYCQGKSFVDIKINKRLSGDKFYLIKAITAFGIDIIEKKEDNEGKRPFNVTFNFNNEFNIDSIIKGEAKLF